MSEALSTKPKNDRSWLPYFGGFLLVCLVLILAAAKYRSHLYWKYLETFHDFSNISAVDVQPLPTPQPPPDWVKVTEGQLEFWLPPDIATQRHIKEGGIGAVMYLNDDRVVAIFTPQELVRPLGPLPPDDDAPSTTPRRLSMVYQTSSDDFNWSMTSDEVAQHSSLAILAEMGNSIVAPPVEVRFEEEFDGLLTVDNRHTDVASFQWESRTCPWEGQFLFRDKTGNLDRQWVRIVCASIRFRCEAESEN